MAQFIPSVSQTRGAIPQHKGDFRFVDFDAVPSLPASGPVLQSKQHVRTYFNNKQIFRTVCEWFETWMPWQKRIILCGTTDRCSTAQLEYLATALEPVFHRDFQTTLRGAYPLLTSGKQTDLQHDKKGYSYYRGQDLVKTVSASLSNFALNFVNDIISEAIQSIKTDQTPKDKDFPLNEEQPSQKSVEKKKEKRKPSPIVEVQEECFSANLLPDQIPRSAKSEMTSSTESFAQVPRSERTSITKQSATSSQQIGLLQIERKSVDTNSLLSQHQRSAALRPLESSFSVRPSERRKSKAKSQAYNHYFYGQEETAFSDDSRISVGESQLDALAPLEAKKMSTFNWCLSHRVAASASSTADEDSGVSPHSRPHRHSMAQPFPGSAASTNDFFDKEKIKKLGPMKGVFRTGQINRPPHVKDIYTTHQKSYKPSKMWRPRPAVTTAKKGPLKEIFKEQVEQIWVWLKEWEDHEKGDLLVELIKMCDQELVRFFASCLMKRLQDRMDINSLPDRVLLHIFSLLTPEDLTETEGVCRRWYFLISHEEFTNLHVQKVFRITPETWFN